VLPHSEACERNKEPILAILREALSDSSSVLEIGSGTGQHAVHFARRLPHLDWQPTDRGESLPALASRVALEGPPNLRTPLALDVNDGNWPFVGVDAVFSANTLHIMPWPSVEALFRAVGRLLGRGGLLLVYGPFRYDGTFTTASNAAFDADLRAGDPTRGIRDFEAVDALARAQGLTLEADHAMPANNQLLAWRR